MYICLFLIVTHTWAKSCRTGEKKVLYVLLKSPYSERFLGQMVGPSNLPFSWILGDFDSYSSIFILSCVCYKKKCFLNFGKTFERKFLAGFWGLNFGSNWELFTIVVLFSKSDLKGWEKFSENPPVIIFCDTFGCDIIGVS